MPSTTLTVDALLVDLVPNPGPGAEAKSFSGTLAIAGLANKTVTGVLRKVDGRLIGALQIKATASYIPINFVYNSSSNLESGTFTFVLPATEYGLAADGFYFAGNAGAWVTNTVVTDTAGLFNAVTVTITNGTKYTPGAAQALATITLTEVAVAFQPIKFAEGDDAMDFSPVAINALSEIKVNQKLNPFENWGLVLGVERLPGERNAGFADRIEEAFVRRAGSNHTGILNAITRDLSLRREAAIRVTKVNSYSGLESDLYIRVVDSWVKLYDRFKDKDTYNLDTEINLRGANVKYVSDVVGQINASASFRAVSLISDATELPAKLLFSQGNRHLVRNERVPRSTAFGLQNKLVRPSTVFFSDIKTFANEVETTNDLLVDGDYHINYDKGLVRSILLPGNLGSVSYERVEIPFEMEISEAVVAELDSAQFRRVMFDQVPQNIYSHPDDATIDGMPTDDMIFAIKELLEASDVYWGS